MPSHELDDLRAKVLAPKVRPIRRSAPSDPLDDFPSESSRRFAWQQRLAGYRRHGLKRLQTSRAPEIIVPPLRALWQRISAALQAARPEHLVLGAGIVLALVALGAVVLVITLATAIPAVSAPELFDIPRVATLTPVAPEIERVDVPPPRRTRAVVRQPGDVDLPAPSRGSATRSSAPGGARTGGATAGVPASAKVDEVVYADSGLRSTGTAAPAPVVEPDPTRIYSADDEGVQPPVPIRAWFLTSRPPNVPRALLTEIEAIVLPTGEVDSAKVVAGPATYTDPMTLSAIKAGKFRPATKDGRPVTFRYRLWVRVPER